MSIVTIVYVSYKSVAFNYYCFNVIGFILMVILALSQYIRTSSIEI